jgi:hypothetical protein
MTNPVTTDHFTEVPVYAGILRANAELLDLFQEFFTDAEPAVRDQLGRYLIARCNAEDTTDAATEAAILIGELTEAADLLHSLADHSGNNPGNGADAHDHDREWAW